MLKKIRLTNNVHQQLEDYLNSHERPIPLDPKEIDEAKRKAKYFLKYGKYPKQKKVEKNEFKNKIKKAIIKWDKKNISSLIEEDIESLAGFIEKKLIKQSKRKFIITGKTNAI